MSGTRVASCNAVVLRRCAWHRKHHGYVLVFGVESWAGWSIRVWDTICPRCAGRLRRQLGGDDAGGSAEAIPSAVPPGAVALIGLGAVLFAAAPLHHPPPGIDGQPALERPAASLRTPTLTVELGMGGRPEGQRPQRAGAERLGAPPAPASGLDDGGRGERVELQAP